MFKFDKKNNETEYYYRVYTEINDRFVKAKLLIFKNNVEYISNNLFSYRLRGNQIIEFKKFNEDVEKYSNKIDWDEFVIMLIKSKIEKENKNQDDLDRINKILSKIKVEGKVYM